MHGSANRVVHPVPPPGLQGARWTATIDGIDPVPDRRSDSAFRELPTRLVHVLVDSSVGDEKYPSVFRCSAAAVNRVDGHGERRAACIGRCRESSNRPNLRNSYQPDEPQLQLQHGATDPGSGMEFAA